MAKRRSGLDNSKTIVQIQEANDRDRSIAPRLDGGEGGPSVEPTGATVSSSRDGVQLEPKTENNEVMGDGGDEEEEEEEDGEVKEYEREYKAVLRLKQQMEKNQANPLRRGNKNIFSGLLSSKKLKEWKLFAFVVFLFCLIVVGLVLIYHFHEEQFFYIYLGQGVIVNERSLEVKFTNANGTTVLLGNLWKGRPAHRLPFDCSDVDLKGQGLCLLWQRRARLEIRTVVTTDAMCHHVTWLSMSPEVEQCNCFELEDATWYGGGISTGTNEWPLEKSSFQKRLFVSGDIHDPSGFGPVLERYWLSSKGVALFMREPFAVQISFNSFDSLLNRTDGQLCIHSYNSGDRHSKETTTTHANLSYSICVANDARQVHSIALPQSIGVKRRNGRPPPRQLFEEPVWSTWSYLKDRFNQSQLEGYAAEVKGRLSLIHI